MNRTAIPRALLLAGTCLTIAASRLKAQNETPEQVARNLWDAVQAQDWGRAAGLMHPLALRQLRDVLNPLILLDGIAADSARQTLFGSVSRDVARAASDSAVYTNLMRFSSSVKAPLPGAMEPTHYQYLGTLREGADTAHVVGRVSLMMQGRPAGWIQVTSLMRSGSTWRGLLEPNWSQLAWALRGAMERRN